MPGISIIVCTYNDSNFLTKCLPICFSQPGETEIIVVDDCSSVPMDKYLDECIINNKVRYIYHERNQGLSAARNTGITAAKYDLCIPMDADDNFYPNVLPQMAAAMTDDTDVVYGNVTDSGRVHYAKQNLTKEMFLQDNPLFCSSLFRKSVWEKAHGYEVLPHAHYEDWGFWSRAFKAGCKFKYVPITVYEHLNRPDSMLKQLHPYRPRFIEIATRALRD